MIQNNQQLIRVKNFLSSHFFEGIGYTGRIIMGKDNIGLSENDGTCFGTKDFFGKSLSAHRWNKLVINYLNKQEPTTGPCSKAGKFRKKEHRYFENVEKY